MSSISINDVKKLSTLSALALSDEQVDAMRHELAQILDYFEMLNEVDTENVTPTYQVTGLSNVMREDVVSSSQLPQDELLKNTPQTEQGLIKVPRVLG
jgi:aspartyl-tRNA(Asn)/glutamyl-tRNA(Gln) amidotransferase subunit C